MIGLVGEMSNGGASSVHAGPSGVLVVLMLDRIRKVALSADTDSMLSVGVPWVVVGNPIERVRPLSVVSGRTVILDPRAWVLPCAHAAPPIMHPASMFWSMARMLFLHFCASFT